MAYKNIEDINIYSKEYYLKNRIKILEEQKLYRQNNKAKIKEYHSIPEVMEKHKISNIKYYQKNKEKESIRHMTYYQQNKEKLFRYSKQYKKQKRKIDNRFSLSDKISRLIRYSLKGKKENKHWEYLVGYTLSDLIKRLKRTIPEGYVWQDYIEGKLHLDHRIPISVHNFTSYKHPDFKNCWALSNLQLLPARENLAKSNKLTKPFQLSLKIKITKLLAISDF